MSFFVQNVQLLYNQAGTELSNQFIQTAGTIFSLNPASSQTPSHSHLKVRHFQPQSRKIDCIRSFFFCVRQDYLASKTRLLEAACAVPSITTDHQVELTFYRNSLSMEQAIAFQLVTPLLVAVSLLLIFFLAKVIVAIRPAGM